MVSVYVGLDDGSFRQTRRVDPTVEIQDKLPPQGAEYAYRWVLPSAGSPLLDHLAFLHAKLQERGSAEQPTTYHPRTRLRYRASGQADTTTMSEPHILPASGLCGVTH